MDSSTDFLLAQEGSNEAYGPGEQLWLTCGGQEHKTAVSVDVPRYAISDSIHFPIYSALERLRCSTDTTAVLCY